MNKLASLVVCSLFLFGCSNDGGTARAQTFTNANLTGTYHYSSYGDSFDSVSIVLCFHSEFGSLTFDGSGNFSGSFRNSDDCEGLSTGKGLTTGSFTGTYSVSVDGSVTLDFGTGAPPTRGRIVNGDTTIVFANVDDLDIRYAGTAIKE